MGDTGLTANRILRSLPSASLDAVARLMTLEHLETGTILQPPDEEIRRCYFPLRGMASLLVTEASGKSVDSAIIGSEGFVGLPVFLGTGRMPAEAMVQLDMDAAAIDAADLRRCLNEEPALANLLQRYTQMVLVELSRLVLCNRVHGLEDRIARWLLLVHDRVNGRTDLEVTHQFLSEMIGSERPSVSSVLQGLVEAGVLGTARGTITVLDPARLEAIACDCYGTIRDELARLTQERTKHNLV